MSGYNGEKHHNWKGGTRYASNGYVLVCVSKNSPYALMRDIKGAVSGHRLVMAESLERCLTEDEIVHHKNGIKDDNRIENLELMTAREHKLLHISQAQNHEVK